VNHSKPSQFHVKSPTRSESDPLLDFMCSPSLATFCAAFPHFRPVKNPARQQDWHMNRNREEVKTNE